MRSLALVLLAACGSSKSAPPAAQTYEVTAVGADTPVKLELTVPSAWKVDTSDRNGPVIEVPGAMHVGFGALMLPMDKSISLQYDDDAQLERLELSGGRLWISETSPDRVHARMFVPFEGGTLMGVAMLRDDERVPEIRAAFETIVIVSPAR